MTETNPEEVEIDFTSKNPIPDPEQPPELQAMVEAMLSDGMSDDK